MNNTMPGSNDQERSEVVELVTRAEASVEALERGAPNGFWAMTAFGRYRVCELLGVTPYESYVGELADDPAGLFDEAAGLVDGFEVSVEGLSWRLALADALRSAAKDIRMVADARDV
ncbi:hypothetical protein [Kribbella italica]|uniref:Uncharacterized protein n=1 Tax=Kribbella italica TaxID=1540520 RepID=A0A7W9JFJ2_9ACTN|nr:hypothetical protein [Kribbella italica]MBB5840583.1 hypothetical protein [Kribbella italica]